MKRAAFIIILLSIAAAIDRLPAAERKTDDPGSETNIVQVSTFQAATALIGKDVLNKRDEQLGQIKDLMLSLQHGRVTYAVLGAGGFLGLGDKLIALPPTALNPSLDGKNLLLEADKESLRAAPGFQSNNWPEMADTKWLTEQDRHYAKHVEANTINEASGAQPNQSKEKETPERQSLLPPPNTKMSSLIGMKVVDLEKKQVGQIKDAAVDLQSGEIRYMVVGSVTDGGEKLMAVAPQSFRKGDSDRTLVVSAPASAFKEADGFPPDKWPKRANADFGGIDEPAGTPRDPSSDGRTALDQSNAKRDLMITQQLRRSIMRDPSMSTLTRNITIITADGVITVRGTVANQKEADRIVAFAKEIAGNQVVNELKVRETERRNQ